MGERAADERLKDLRDKGYTIYSISRLNTLHQCAYQAYLHYVLGVKDKGGNVWSYLGGKTHDAIESVVLGQADTNVIKQAILDELEDLEMAGIEFPLGRDGKPSMRDNWIANMTRFAEEFTRPNGKFETEQLILYPVNDHAYMQGYIDAIRYNADGSIWIIDWKTSSQFTKDHLIEAGRQLILYALAKQLEGYEVKKVSWCMLKYCRTVWTLKNGKEREKISEWRNLIKDLRSPIYTALKEAGYDEIESDFYYDEALKTNRWESLPESVRNRFKTSIYVRDYEMTPELVQETIDYINKTIELYETLGDEKNWKPCDVDKDSFFCSSLCGYGGKGGSCKYWQEYIEKFKAKDEEEDEFADLF